MHKINIASLLLRRRSSHALQSVHWTAAWRQRGRSIAVCSVSSHVMLIVGCRQVLRHVFFGRPPLRLPSSGIHDIATFECRWLSRRSIMACQAESSLCYGICQFSWASSHFLRLLGGPVVTCKILCSDGKHVQSLLLFSTFHWHIFQQIASSCPCVWWRPYRPHALEY